MSSFFFRERLKEIITLQDLNISDWKIKELDERFQASRKDDALIEKVFALMIKKGLTFSVDNLVKQESIIKIMEEDDRPPLKPSKFQYYSSLNNLASKGYSGPMFERMKKAFQDG